MMPDKSENEISYQLALKYLKYRPRSRVEIRNYLKRKRFADTTIQKAVRRLESTGLLNDHEFARTWVENRSRLKPKGVLALRLELRNKGIEEEIIDSMVKSDDEEKNAWTAVQSKIKRWQPLEKKDLKKKVISFLQSRGFSFKTSMEIYNRIADLASIAE